MSKRRAEEAFQEDWKEPEPVVKAKVNSLDSDEEDDDGTDGQNYQILEEDDIEGQEEGAVGHEGDIQLTPFNMKEELDEGHFDTDGMYHWNKEKVVKDNWLENIDWVKIKDVKKADPDESEDAEFLKPKFDDFEAYKKIVALMKPGESVAKALRRLGGNKTLSASERWKKKKQAAAESSSTSGEDETKLVFNEMTDLASNILTHTGNMDIYQETFEQISTKIQNHEKSTKKPVLDDLDMYADDFDIKEKEKLEDRTKPTDEISKASKEPEKDDNEKEKELRWEFKWKKDDDKIEGPFSSDQMQKWTESGRFTEEIWVRKCGSGGEFYTNKRIDFELYL